MVIEYRAGFVSVSDESQFLPFNTIYTIEQKKLYDKDQKCLHYHDKSVLTATRHVIKNSPKRPNAGRG